ncbi:hypothetical protein [Paenibacillus andongensis]|nr:hypothetical protein [Paenibacillus andongensis]
MQVAEQNRSNSGQKKPNGLSHPRQFGSLISILRAKSKESKRQANA